MNGEMERGAVGVTRISYMPYVFEIFNWVCLFEDYNGGSKAANQKRYRAERGKKTNITKKFSVCLKETDKMF